MRPFNREYYLPPEDAPESVKAELVELGLPLRNWGKSLVFEPLG